MSLMGILNMAQTSIGNNQAALNIVSNNISNMNNGNYSKQRVEMSAMGSYDMYSWCSSSGSLKLGHGAEITAISRNRDQALDNYVREQNASMGYYNHIGAMTSNIENLLNNELSATGIQQKLSNFFASSQALTGDPTNNAYRISFVESAKNVADQLNGMSSTLEKQRTDAVGKIGDPDSFNTSTIKLSVDDLNQKLGQLAKINGEIAQSSTGNSANNNLLDQRDALLDELSGIIPLKTTTNPNNTVNVYIDNQVVVKGGEQKLQIKATQGATDDHPVNIQLLDMEGNIKKNDVSDSLKSGGIKAIIDTGSTSGTTYKTVQDEIDRIANAFAQEMNRIQTATDANGTPMFINANGRLEPSTTPLFVTNDGSTPPPFTAANITINQAVVDDPKLVATARVVVDPLATPPYDDTAVGNTGNMGQFNGLKDLAIPGLSNSTPVGAGQTLGNFIKGLVSDVGSKIQSLNEAGTTQKNVLLQAANKRGAVTGVNLNEELTDLIKYQRAYEASARVFNAASELMQVISRLGQ